MFRTSHRQTQELAHFPSEFDWSYHRSWCWNLCLTFHFFTGTRMATAQEVHSSQEVNLFLKN
jgi:hypothetical protein